MLLYLFPVFLESLPIERRNVVNHGPDLSIALLGFVGCGDLGFSSRAQPAQLLLLHLFVFDLLLETRREILLTVALVHGLLDTDLLHRLWQLSERVVLLARLEGLENGFNATGAPGCVGVGVILIIEKLTADFVFFIFLVTGQVLVNVLLVEVHVAVRTLQKLVLLLLLEVSHYGVFLVLAPLLVVLVLLLLLLRNLLVRFVAVFACQLVELLVLVFIADDAVFRLVVVVRRVLRVIFLLLIIRLLFLRVSRGLTRVSRTAGFFQHVAGHVVG